MSENYPQFDLLQNISDDLDSILATGSITTIDITAIGAVDDARETDPDSASTTVVALLRGVLYELHALNAVMADVYNSGDHALQVEAP